MFLIKYTILRKKRKLKPQIRKSHKIFCFSTCKIMVVIYMEVSHAITQTNIMAYKVAFGCANHKYSKIFQKSWIAHKFTVILVLVTQFVSSFPHNAKMYFSSMLLFTNWTLGELRNLMYICSICEFVRNFSINMIDLKFRT